MRAVLDPNVIISALLSPIGAPAQVLQAWRRGDFELVLSTALIAELERALGYPKLRRRIPSDDADRVVAWLSTFATVRPDPEVPPPRRSADPGDDYLLALAADAGAALVSGDDHLLGLADELPVFSARGYLAFLESRAGGES